MHTVRDLPREIFIQVYQHGWPGLGNQEKQNVFIYSDILYHRLFFNCYLAAPWSTFGYCRVDSLTKPMISTTFR